MTIDLLPETQRLLEQQLKTGRYATPDEAVRAGLSALHEQEWDELDAEALDAIDRAEAQIERGEGVKFSEVREQIRASFRGE